LVPLLLAGWLGTLRVNDSVSQARALDTMERQIVFTQHVSAAVHDLQRERRLAVEVLARGNDANRAELRTQGQRVDLGISGLSAPGSNVADLDNPSKAAYQAAQTSLSGLPALRQAALGGATNPDDALTRYTTMIAGLLGLNRVVLNGSDAAMDRKAAGIDALSVAKEQFSEEHAELLSALYAGTLTPARQAALRNNDARFNAALDEFGEAMPPAQRQIYADTVRGAGVTQGRQLLATALEQARQDGPLRIDPVGWDNAATETADRVRQVESTLLDRLGADTASLSDEAWHTAIRDACVVALLLVLAVALLVVVVRSLLQPLRTLRTGAFEVADSGLPEAVEKLRVTDGSVGETVVDPVPVYSRDEVGQVARAFDTVHLQAVRLAAEQAILRNTVNDIFLNLAGRSQRLVERQLRLIDELENSEQDPEQLASLFQLDHLATRMRRNSENLLVLAGGTLRSVSEHGIAVLDLLRAAVSEIEEYQRVTVRRPPAATVSGPVVNDLVHLVAELLDNATISAPPDAPVTLSSSLTDDGGLLVEITDCGTGLSPTELHEINERLASTPMVDVAVSQHMGLFVVSRLAARHGIRVRLRQQQREFGITASVLLPADLVATDQTPTDQVSPVPLSPVREPTARMPTVRTPPATSGPGERFAGPTGGYDVAADEGEDYPAQYATAAVSGSADDPGADPDEDPAEDEPDYHDDRDAPALPPIAVSVVDAQAHDLFNPSSIGHIPRPTPKPEPKPARSTVEEWAELFGRDEPEQSQQHGAQPAEELPVLPRRTPKREASPPPPAPSEDTPPPRRPTSGDAQLPRRTPKNREQAPPPAPAPAAEVGRNGTDQPPVREQIYEMVSAWFQEQRSAPAQADSGRPDPAGESRGRRPQPFEASPQPAAAPESAAPWRSAADVGWTAADALRSPAQYEVTESGLPRRRPKAHLVPGAASADFASPPPSAAGPARNPDDVRGRLSSYQRGLRHGRHARINPDEQTTRAAVPRQGRFEEDQ
ncbi:MAG TPA: nitrate- and nitrite sensing domain-containing protein, partial [Pseudonocardiaceae bacterium]